MIKTVGSICSGIEAASIAWKDLNLKFEWFSEIASFPSLILKEKYPDVQNLGDMNYIDDKLLNNEINAPDLICAGTPCQAFSFAGWQNGLEDDRGNLTLKFVEIIEANDIVREQKGKNPTVVFWENVEGVLSDKTNAFGCMVSSLAGLSETIEIKRWSKAGLIRGPKRNVAWRVLDAKYFGLPQQRKRLYLLAGGKDFFPEKILFEHHTRELIEYPSSSLEFIKEGHEFEIFREYTDCLYSAYGTKWNGNAAATNGSLFVAQNNRIRRLSPLECERLMGFPDNYTEHPKGKRTTRYQAIGNSWAVPVIKWIGNRIFNGGDDAIKINSNNFYLFESIKKMSNDFIFFDFNKGIIKLNDNLEINCTSIPEESQIGKMYDIVCCEVPEELYISPVGCYGIIRRKTERKLSINRRLEEILLRISSEMPLDEIEKKSKIQKRGKNISLSKESFIISQEKSKTQLSIFK